MSNPSKTDPTHNPSNLPVWHASCRMAVVAAAGLVAAALMATGLAGCADMSGISPKASLHAGG